MIAEHFPPRRLAGRAHFALSFLCTLLISFSCAASTNRPAGGPGIVYEHDEVPDAPWSIHVVKVERGRADLGFETTLGANQQLGMGLVSDQLKSVPPGTGRVLAAINGDFYNYENKDYAGDPKGLQIVRGELVSAPDEGRSCFWIDAAGNPRITNVQSRFSVTLPDGRSAPVGLNEERKDGAMVLFTKAFGASTRAAGGTEIVIKRGTGTNWLPLAIGKTYVGEVQEIRTGGNSPVTADTIVLSVHPKVPPRKSAGLKTGDVVRISTATSPDLEGYPDGDWRLPGADPWSENHVEPQGISSPRATHAPHWDGTTTLFPDGRGRTTKKFRRHDFFRTGDVHVEQGLR